jgi:DNA modification methylase
MPTIIRADARSLPLDDRSVDLVVTSPPYFGMRSYQDGGRHYESQIGSEATPIEYLDALCAVTRECMRVLKPTGSLWVNLGDKYGGAAWANKNGTGESGLTGVVITERTQAMATARSLPGTRQKSLIGIPWRYALRCTDDLGLILRAEVIWSKPNGLPESVTDRVRRSHEQWFHFTLQPRYYSAVDEIREATTRTGLTWAERKAAGNRTHAPDNGHATGGPGMAAHTLGKLPDSVWTVATQPLTVPEYLGADHYAAFPTELPRRIILGWSPRDVCTVCGEGRRPVSDRESVLRGYAKGRVTNLPNMLDGRQGARRASAITVTGYACACPDVSAASTPGVVVDPFGGTGTTALVATMLGRSGITVDASADYCRIAQWRCHEAKERARAAGLDPDAVSKIKPPGRDQGDLFAEDGAA